MTHRQLNIFRVYSLADADEIDAGLRWYAEVHEDATRIAAYSGKSVSTVSAIIAALSPGLRWSVNVEAAERVINGKSLSGLGVRWGDGRDKAIRILNGHDPRVVLGGNKVRSFWHCIAEPTNRSHVCVDGHAYAIAVGKRITVDKTPNINDRLYNVIRRDYIAVANAIGIAPYQLQAITWLAWRRLHAVKI
jgi:hypothetical protein